jgi:aspartyl-tRNA(Asn)/glutamyl-tRNA(Gln) amidotransferase subunit C
MLTADQVRTVAKLARLSLSDDRIEQLRGELSGVLTFMNRLSEVDVSGVEPMTHPTEMSNRLDEDQPGGVAISTEAFMAMAPESVPPFVKVPPVIGEGSA